MHGSNALLSIQQTHREISDKLWNICFSHNLVHTPVRELIRQNWKPVYHSNSLYDRIKLTLYSALESCCSCRTRAAPSLDGAI